MTDSFLSHLEEHVSAVKEAAQVLTYEEYLKLVQDRPRIAQLSHARLYGMVKSAGITKKIIAGEEIDSYDFFSQDLFGNDDVIAQAVSFLHSGAKRLESRKRILLLMGPPGSGKSQFVTLMKRGMEEFSLADDGAFYGVKYPTFKDFPYSGQLCPMREEPLHAIPHSLRPEFPVHIEGDLCPRCRLIVDQYLDGDFTRLEAQRVVISEQSRIGIGVFQPSDPKSQDITDLVGSMDLSAIGEFGSESDPRAYRFDGEANVASRGALEMVEMLKVDDKFLYLLLTLTQEQAIKAGRFPNIYADEVIIAHSNEAEFNAWKADKKSEALRDRVIVIKCPYNLRVDDEIKIYNKLISQTTIIKDVHIDPLALNAAAKFAILTRLEEPTKAGYDLIKKLKLYNGEHIAGVKDKDVKELKEATEREGMDGLGPRFIINQLASALVKTKDGNKKRCLTTIETLRSLKDGLDASPSLSKESREKYNNFIIEARKEYDEEVKIEVQKAFVHSFVENANTSLKVYLDNIEAYCSKDKVKHPVTQEEMEPDEKFMRSIEEQIGISDVAAKSFREDILMRMASYYRKGTEFTYDSHPRLKEAIEKKLFNDLKDMVKITTSTKTPDKDQLERINVVAKRLMDEHGYCEVCASELLSYVGSLLAR